MLDHALSVIRKCTADRPFGGAAMADDTFGKRNPWEPRLWVAVGASELFEWLKPRLGHPAFKSIPDDAAIGQVWQWVQLRYVRHCVPGIEPMYPWFRMERDRDFGNLVIITERGWDRVEWQSGLIKGTDCKVRGLCADIELCLFAAKQEFERRYGWRAPAAASSASAVASNFAPIANNNIITISTGAPTPSTAQATVPEPGAQRGSQTEPDGDSATATTEGQPDLQGQSTPEPVPPDPIPPDAPREATTDQILAAKRRLNPKAGARAVQKELSDHALLASVKKIRDALRPKDMLGEAGAKVGRRKSP